MTAGDQVNVSTDLLAWIALRRVHRGGVLHLQGRYFDHERPVPGYLTDTLDALTRAGMLALVDTDSIAQRVTVTDAGCARYVTWRGHRRRGLRSR
ncbi:MAG: hypothetical protein ACRDT0_13870 [Pseudonocardiaceae bacterium]